MSAAKNLAGMTFGRLTVLEKTDKRTNSKIVWQCQCECGTTKLVSSTDLLHGEAKSCGCFRREVKRTHGRVYSGEYGSWDKMIQRCRNPNTVSFHRYGGRGIKVCERWRLFENFLADMGERPAGMSLDRIDNDGHYEPGNCRWATRTEQSRNMSRNRLLTFNGETMPVSAWAEKLRLPRKVLEGRLRNGWSIDRALTTPQMIRADGFSHWVVPQVRDKGNSEPSETD